MDTSFGRLGLAALQPYFGANLVYFLKLAQRPSGNDVDLLREMMSPLSAAVLYGDQRIIDRIRPRVLEDVRQSFPLRCRLPAHVIPVCTDFGTGFNVPMTCDLSDEWDASDAFGRFRLDGRGNPSDGLLYILERIGSAWHSLSGSGFPLRWRRAYALNLAIPVHVGGVDGDSMQLPLALMILREAAWSFTGRWPFGKGPVFCTSPIRGDMFKDARDVEAKLRGFIREFGRGRAAILTDQQKERLERVAPELLAAVKTVSANGLTDLLKLGPLQAGLQAVSGPPHPSEIDHLTRLMTTLQRGVRFADSLGIGEYLLPHAWSAPYRTRVCCGVAHLMLHQGKVQRAKEYLRIAEPHVREDAGLGADVRAHYLAIKGIHLLDCGEPLAALHCLEAADLAPCSYISRIEVIGTKSQALRALSEFDGAVEAARAAVDLAKEGLASEAGRDLNYVAHALIRKALDLPARQRRPLLKQARAHLAESKGPWAPVEPRRFEAHQLFCRHYIAEWARAASRRSHPGEPPRALTADWMHAWLFILLSCSRNPANGLVRRREWATQLVRDSEVIMNADPQGGRIVFELFHRVYRVWEAAIHDSEVGSHRDQLLGWCDRIARRNGVRGWMCLLGPILREMPETPEARIEWADRLCSAIYFH